MKLLQHAILVVIGVGIVLAGAALAALPISTLYDILIAKVPDNDMWRIGIGLSVAALALLAILPFGGFRRGRRITFQSAQGNVSFQLDSVEAALRKSLKKLPTVKRVDIEVCADENSRKVRVGANVLLYKAGGASAREAAIRLSDEIARQARQLLGADEVATVDLNIDGIIVDGKDAATAPVETFSSSVKDTLPTGRSETAKPAAPAAPAVAPAVAPLAAAAAPAPLPDVTGWEAPEKLAPLPANDDLLTYEDSLKLRDEEPEEDAPDISLEPDDDEEAQDESPESTSFSSLADDDTQGPDKEDEDKSNLQ